jgi:Lipase (class 3)
MSTGTFDPWQQVFTMSMLVNREGHATGQTAAQLQGNLASIIQDDLEDSQFQSLIGDSWEIAWGPCVFQNSGSGVVDNAMFVAENTATNTYVVAIAATSFHSVFDKSVEDASVNPIKAWPYGQAMPPGATFPAGVAIAPGTTLGVNVLLNMPNAEGQTGPSLAAFLQSVQSSTATVVFTGHSLGGALAPTLACALITQGDLDPADWAHVYVYPTAGPTPGNASFVTLFQTLFPQTAAGSQPWQVWSSLLWNSLDIVPHAWNETTLSQIASLYLPTVSPGAIVLGALAAAALSAQGQGYQQLPSKGALAGTFLPPSSIPNPLASPASFPFMAEALYQHIDAYFALLGVQSLQLLLASPATALLSEKAA